MDQKIADSYPDHKHRITSADYPHDIFPLIGIQSRRYEPEQLIEDVGRRIKHTGTQCRLHVDDELLCQSRVDELHGKTAGFTASPCRNPVEKTICDKAVVLRSENNGKQLLLKTKGGDTEHNGYGYDFDNRCP